MNQASASFTICALKSSISMRFLSKILNIYFYGDNINEQLVILLFIKELDIFLKITQLVVEAGRGKDMKWASHLHSKAKRLGAIFYSGTNLTPDL
jgi:hypothetical protein